MFVALGLAVSTATTASAQAPSPQDQFTATPLTPSGTIVGDFSKAARASDGRVPVIVQLADDAVATYRGGIRGLAATRPSTGDRRLDSAPRRRRAYRAYLGGKQAAFEREAQAAVPAARVLYRYDLVGGMAMSASYSPILAALARCRAWSGSYRTSRSNRRRPSPPSSSAPRPSGNNLGGQAERRRGRDRRRARHRHLARAPLVLRPRPVGQAVRRAAAAGRAPGRASSPAAPTPAQRSPATTS